MNIGLLVRRMLYVFLPAISISAPLYGYEVETHTQLTRNAVSRSILVDSDVLRRLGLYPEMDATWLKRPNNGVYADSWFNEAVARSDLLVEVASRKEDVGARALQHFFDPQNNRGQTVTDASSGDKVTVGLRSPIWALNRSSDWIDVPTEPDVVPSEQYFTIENGKDYLEHALVASDRMFRLRAYGQFLSSIGHVVHHIQDMAQPDHVRNDPHCNVFKCMLAELKYSVEEDIYDPSEYEPFVLSEGYAAFNQWDYPIPQFDSYNSFWTTPDNTGISDFTNRFAVSKDTNFRGSPQLISTHPEFPYPNGESAVTMEEVTSLDLLYGMEVSYVQTAVYASYSDVYLGSTPSNSHLTATHSLFALDISTAELLGYDITAISDEGFTIGRKTFLSAAEHLLPRAEAYSAGLINYMLRGRLGVQLPERGYYALSDFAPDKAFTTLRFQLRNETPDVQPMNRAAIPQDAGSGRITAVVSYRPNPCYEDDLSGELHVDEASLIPSGCTWQTWEAVDEVRVTSVPIVVGSISRDWSEYEFDFSANPIPFSARDVEVFFVFRGDLGSEDDAIIVERKNISEPTYYTTWNSSDWVWTSDGWQDGYALLTNGDPLDDILAAQYHDMSYDYDLTDPFVTGEDRLLPARFHRIVALVDPDARYTLRYQKTPELYWPSTASYSWNPLLNETREAKDQTVVNFLGFELKGPFRYRNTWCDDQGCTLSGLARWRGYSTWSMLREYYVNGHNVPDPTPDDWKALGEKIGAGQQPVTIHE